MCRSPDQLFFNGLTNGSCGLVLPGSIVQDICRARETSLREPQHPEIFTILRVTARADQPIYLHFVAASEFGLRQDGQVPIASS